MTESVKVWKSPKDLPRVIGRGLCDLSSRGIWWGLSVLSCVFRTGCPGLCVLRFKYLAAPTRRTTVIAVGTSLPNHCLHRATGSISSALSFPCLCVDEIDRYCLKTLTEDFLNFLNPISSVTLSSAPLSCLHATCALGMFHFIMMTMFLSCYACTWVLIPLLVVRHLANSSSSISSMTSKIAYSLPLVDIIHFQLVSEQGTPLFYVILI